MSPVAPMPQMAWVGTNGLNAWVIVLSGELSMTSVLEEPELFDPVVEVLDPHAAAPAARRAAAALTATSFLGPVNLEIIWFPCPRTVETPYFCDGGLARHVPPPCDCARMPGAATSRRQQAAARTAETRRNGGSSARQRSSASGHRGLNGQPCVAGPVVAGWRPPGAVPPRSALPRLSGSGAEATRSWV